MRKLSIIIILAFMLSFCLTPLIHADDSQPTDDKFIYVIDGMHLITISPDIVSSSHSLVLVHNYISLSLTYTYENGTVIKKQKIVTNVIQLKIYDDTHLVLTDTENNVVMDIHIHAMNIENFFKYVFPLQYQQLAVSVILAFISSAILIVAFYIKHETKII